MDAMKVQRFSVLRRRSRILRCARGAAQALAAIAVLTVLTAPGRATAVEPWPEVPMPPKAKVEWIAPSLRINGIPTRVMQFESRASRTEIVDYYRTTWSGGAEHKPSVRPVGQLTVVGQTHGPYLMTIEVADGPRGTSHGLISVARVLGSSVDRNPGVLPLLGGAHLVSVVESDDPGKRSRQMVVVSPQAPATVTDFYRASFVNAGWREVQSTDAPGAAGRPAGSFLVFAQGDSELQLSIVESRNRRGSAVLANLVTKDTGTVSR